MIRTDARRRPRAARPVARPPGAAPAGAGLGPRDGAPSGALGVRA